MRDLVIVLIACVIMYVLGVITGYNNVPCEHQTKLSFRAPEPIPPLQWVTPHPDRNLEIHKEQGKGSYEVWTAGPGIIHHLYTVYPHEDPTLEIREYPSGERATRLK